MRKKMDNAFKFNLGDPVLHDGVEREIIARLKPDNAKNNTYYLLSLHGPPVHQDSIKPMVHFAPFQNQI